MLYAFASLIYDRAGLVFGDVVHIMTQGLHEREIFVRYNILQVRG